MSYFIKTSEFRSRDFAVPPTTQNKIVGFAEYFVGWHFGEGMPPTEDAIDRALQFETYLRSLGFAETDAFLGVSGEIMVTGYEGDNYVEVLVEVNGQFGLVYEHGETEELNEEQRPEEWVRQQLRELADRLWNAFDLSTPITTIGENVDSQVWRFGIQQTAARQLLTEHVSTPAGTQYVSILSCSIPTLYPVIPPYIGNSTPRSSPTRTG